MERDCRTKRCDQAGPQASRPQANFVSTGDNFHNEEPTPLKLFATFLAPTNQEPDQWYFDIGATHHMTYNYDWLTNYTPLPKPLEVLLGDDSVRRAEGFGDIRVLLTDGQTT